LGGVPREAEAARKESCGSAGATETGEGQRVTDPYALATWIIEEVTGATPSRIDVESMVDEYPSQMEVS
jgi:hypothetical protein